MTWTGGMAGVYPDSLALAALYLYAWFFGATAMVLQLARQL